ncbi:mas-related G-protein coupled receptor member H-like [Anolis sagrei]|uniref:mas-related G-protein coupled receptor member H-like n=1 Tax=Anolis sagrei TaxID=38937 RepID=UPI0035218F0B
MTTFSKSLFSSLNESLEYNESDYLTDYNDSQNGNTLSDNWDDGFFIISLTTFLICLPGLVGNGIVIWLLGFRIKRTPFTTYILNLAIADFAVLSNEIIRDIYSLLNWINPIFYFLYFHEFYLWIFLFTFTASQYLMTIISIDRCVCLFFPLWHRCHRPPHLSTVACVIVWILGGLTPAMTFTLIFYEYVIIRYFQFFLNAVVCMPIMCVSTIAMFIKFCLRPPQKKKGKLLRTIWIILFFFLLFAFPFNVIQLFSVLLHQAKYSYGYAYSSVFLNSAINPMIYYLVGRDKRGRSSKQINKVLEKLFKEKEDCRENQEI